MVVSCARVAWCALTPSVPETNAPRFWLCILWYASILRVRNVETGAGDITNTRNTTRRETDGAAEGGENWCRLPVVRVTDWPVDA